jgi:hypothetical protein
MIRLAVAVLLLGACSSKDSYDLDGGDLITVGGLFLKQRGCAMCHGDASSGWSGQSDLQATMEYGSNLTPDVDTGLGAWADIEIIRAMRYGVDNHQMPLCPTMPHFDGSDKNPQYHDAMTDLEANAIVAYLRSLPAVSRKIPDSMCPPLKPAPPLDMSLPGGPNDLASMNSD